MSKAVLVVEDEVGVRRVLARLLGEKGFRTIEAGNGREAIERLAEETPAAIIIDLFMPIMSGIELLKALRRNAYYKKIPTVVMTGSGVAEVWGVPTVMKPNIEGIPDMVEAMVMNADAEAGVPRAAMAREASSAIQ
ncbi:MAG TPA: response regulator [Polyangia bacterium]|jgi:CheY-like chemotaxis protein|nr:response regulator [Polyangia bacterium]